MNRHQIAAARRFELLKYLSEHRSHLTSFAEIEERFETPPAGLQNDLNVLIAMGCVEKPRRDAYRVFGPMLERVYSQVYRTRRSYNAEVKERVALRCLRHKREDGTPLLGGRFCFVSPGTTTEPLFHAMKTAPAEQLPQHVVTNSLTGLMVLLEYGRVGLTIVGGRPDPDAGAIRPQGVMGLHPEPGRNHARSHASPWLGPVQCDLAVLSISAASESGELFCSDDMEEFRRSVIELGVEVVILADMTKLRGLPKGSRIHVEPNWDRTWLFVDKPVTGAQADFCGAFKDKMGPRFVTI